MSLTSLMLPKSLQYAVTSVVTDAAARVARRLSVAVMLLPVVLLGCGDGGEQVMTTQEYEASVQSQYVMDAGTLKATLADIADTGMVGSSIAGMEESIGQIEDESKRAKLLDGYQKLTRLEGPPAKRVAASMVKTLEE